MDLIKSMRISASGMQAQDARLRVISENLANSDSLGQSPGADPYRRKIVSFKNVLDRTMGTDIVKVAAVSRDQAEFGKRLDRSHPAADQDGYVKVPNVNPLIELADMRQAQRSYEANLSMVEVSKGMLMRTIDLLRNGG
jgi:flagellar basal-body rod protein FlgC